MISAIRHLEALNRHEEADRMRERAGLSEIALDPSAEPPPIYADAWSRYQTLSGFRRSGFGFHRIVIGDAFSYWEKTGAHIPMPDVELLAYMVCDNAQIELHEENSPKTSDKPQGRRTQK